MSYSTKMKMYTNTSPCRCRLSGWSKSSQDICQVTNPITDFLSSTLFCYHLRLLFTKRRRL